jgi:hypothetical protein
MCWDFIKKQKDIIIGLIILASYYYYSRNIYENFGQTNKNLSTFCGARNCNNCLNGLSSQGGCYWCKQNNRCVNLNSQPYGFKQAFNCNSNKNDKCNQK